MTRRYLELIPKQLRDIRMQLWNIPEQRESFTSLSAEVIIKANHIPSIIILRQWTKMDFNTKFKFCQRLLY